MHTHMYIPTRSVYFPFQFLLCLKHCKYSSNVGSIKTISSKVGHKKW